MSGVGVWRLEKSLKQKDLAVRAGDLTYTSRHFLGTSEAANWEAPSFEVLDANKRAPDVVTWMAGPPIVSGRFFEAMGAITEGLVEYLPFHVIKKKQYFVMNVLNVVDDAVNLQESEILYGDEPKGFVISVKRVVFKPDRVDRLPEVFKLALQPNGNIYVRQRFCETVAASKFSGICFSDPAVDSFRAYVRGQPLNIYPGIPDFGF